MAGTYDDHTAEAARLLGNVCNAVGDPLLAGEEDLSTIAVYLGAAQVQATLALAAAVREVVVATTLPAEALDTIRTAVAATPSTSRGGYRGRKKSRRSSADPPAEDLTTPTQ